MDQILAANWNVVKDLINNKDFDWLHVTCGKEGIGKSTDNIHNCMEIDPEFFEKDNVIVTVPELKRAFREATKGSAIAIDEGGAMFYCRDAMTKETKLANKLLMGLRGKNCFVSICMPNLFDIDKYILMHRVCSCSRVVSRGRAWFYSKAKIVQMLNQNKKFKTQKWIDPNFKYSFPKLPKDIEAKYKAMKDNIMEDYTDETPKKTIIAQAREMLAQGKKPIDVARDLNTSVRYISRNA